MTRLTPEDEKEMRSLHRRRLPLFPAHLTRLFTEIDALRAENERLKDVVLTGLSAFTEREAEIARLKQELAFAAQWKRLRPTPTGRGQ